MQAEFQWGCEEECGDWYWDEENWESYWVSCEDWEAMCEDFDWE